MYCAELFERLNNEAALRPLVAQFVPLKVETGQKDSWQAWSSKYRAEGAGIPIVYMIRADGEQLYGKSGGFEGNELPIFLMTYLRRAGRILPPKQLTQIGQTLERARAAEAKGDAATAVKCMLSLRRIGTLGDFGSYAAIAMEADDYYRSLELAGSELLEQAQAEMAEPKTAFRGVLGLLELQTGQGQLPSLRADVLAAVRNLRQTESLATALKQVEVFNQARTLAKRTSGRPKAIAYLESICSHFPDSQAAEFARLELDRIARLSEPDSEQTTAETSVSDEQRKVASYLRLAKSCAATKPDTARAYIEKVLESRPTKDQAEEARQLLESLP